MRKIVIVASFVLVIVCMLLASVLSIASIGNVESKGMKSIVNVTAGTTPTIDGTLAAGEWDDAKNVSLTKEGTEYAKAYLKHDGANLYIGFDIQIEEDDYSYLDEIWIYIDKNNDKGTDPQTDDISVYTIRETHPTNADEGYWRRGTGTGWQTVDVGLPSGWSGKTNTTSTAWYVEYKIGYAALGITAATPKTIGIGFRVKDQVGGKTCSWPEAIDGSVPNTWGDASSSDNWATPYQHVPIYIDGNSQFTAENGVSNPSAAGTPDDPYIIENWDINASTANGIDIRNTDAYFIIKNCVIHGGIYGPWDGIYFYLVENGKIDNVTSYNNICGIRLYSSSNNNTITNCSVYNNSYGIFLYDSSNNNIITNCTVYNNSIGIYLAYSSNNNTITGCAVYNNSWYGICLDSSSNNQIINCSVYNNNYGIHLCFSSNNNLIYHNNFINNTCNAYDDSTNYWDNGVEGNYWSDYTGVDAVANFTYSPVSPTDLDTVDFVDLSEGGDSIGNTPYSIPGGTTPDHYPLMRPVEEGVHATTIVSWAWNFGDGNTSSLQNPTHQYFYGGTYCVSLTVTDSEGASDTCQMDITVKPTHLSPHSPISINGNSQFIVGQNGVTSGNGTQADPYIIENWDINASTATGIDIRNTNVYFIIRNCVIHDGDYIYYGIYFYNVQNSKIQNITSYNNFDGIELYYSSNNNLSDNYVCNNYHGIVLCYFSNNNLSDNYVYNNSRGIYLDHFSNNNLSDNYVYNNSDGIYLFESSNNLIYNNYFNNTNNVYISGGSGNKWNISKTLGTNIIGGPYLGGNYWSDYTGCDMDGDGLGDTNLPYGPGDYLPLTAPNLAPIANFTWSPLIPTDLETVQFTSTSTDPDNDVLTYYWSFGDGYTSTLQNPTHQYADNGIYTVTLTVTDIHGASNTTSKQITVLNVPPVANFTYEPLEPMTNMSVGFLSNSADLDGYIVSYYMEFGDGTTEEDTYGYFSHTYSKAGTYQVNLTVTDNDGTTNTTSKQITVAWETTISAYLQVNQPWREINVVWPWENITVTFNATLYVKCYYSTFTEVNISSDPNETAWASQPEINWTLSFLPRNVTLSPCPTGSQTTIVINITFTQPITSQIVHHSWEFRCWVTATIKIIDMPQYSQICENYTGVKVSRTFSDSADYDNDGIPDAAEVWLGLNPANSSDALLDPDSDGWDNLHEYLNGTNMHNWDTDGDSLSDAFEIIFSKTNPLIGDTNGNGMGDGLEFIQNQGYSGSMEILPNGWIGMTIACANYTMYAETNSSVLEGRYDKDKKTLRIKIHGPPETTGVANITIPKDMVGSEKDIKIQLDGNLINYTLSQNATHYFIHIEYTHSTHELAARFTPVSGIVLSKPVNPTKDSLTLSWDACISPEFAKYEIYRSTVSGALGSLIATITDPDTVSYTVTNLSPDTIYYFTVRVVYTDGFYADADHVLVLIAEGKNVNVVYNGTGNLSVGNVSATKIEFLKEKIPSGKKDIGVFVNVTKIGEVGYANITIRYNESDIVGIDPATLIMYYWNETSSKWESCAKIGTTGVDTINKIVWANVTHLTIFAPMAEKIAEQKVAPISLLSYIIIFAVTVILVITGIGVKKRTKKEKTMTVRCPKCGETSQVPSAERPLSIVCPKCGTKGTLK